MTFIIYGVGAIGGTIAARLAESGEPVAGIARGAQLEAIRHNGLNLVTPSGASRVHFPCHADPAEIALAPDDIIFLTMKGQDTAFALERLRAAGVTDQPIFCMQNGVDNERLALRLFPNIHAVTVIMPATFTVPGEVVAFGAPHPGIFDIGRYPGGLDKADEAVAAALRAAGFAAFAQPQVMESKYGKLLMNLGNVIDAAMGEVARQSPIGAAARAEGEAVLAAAGIAHRGDTETDPRRDQLMRVHAIEGYSRVGSSSTQSLARGTGSIETDYLNGEIVLLGRLHGVPAPVNSWLVALGQRMVRENRPAGSFPLDVAMSELHGLLPG